MTYFDKIIHIHLYKALYKFKKDFYFYLHQLELVRFRIYFVCALNKRIHANYIFRVKYHAFNDN